MANEQEQALPATCEAAADGNFFSADPALSQQPARLMRIEARTIEGAHVQLEPLTPEHREAMRVVLESDPANWRMQTVSALGEHFDGYWAAMTGTPGRITFAVRDRRHGTVAGTSSFLQIDPQHRSLEIGYTFFRPEYRGTLVNPETKLLMLGTAFDAGAVRVQFSVSAVNVRSQAAVLKLGARKEGVLRRHRIAWTGDNRDTILFSIVEDEWPQVRAGLERRLAGAC